MIRKITAICCLLLLLPALLFTGCESLENLDLPEITLPSLPDVTQPAEPEETPVTPDPEPPVTPAPAGGAMKAYFFDVGQADATLLIGDDFSVLIDAGDYAADDVVPHLRAAGVTSLDLLIGTHPHADHIGQFPQVLEAFEVKEVWLSGDTSTSRTFERALDAVLASEANYREPRAGESYRFGSLLVEVLHPARITGDYHEGSVSIRATFGSVSFILTGDAEAPQEREMIERGHPLAAQVLQLGHHGSSTSNCREFLEAVNPQIAVYSAGIDNSYGHPHAETVDLIASLGIPLYGTDVCGTIIVETDGAALQLSTEKTAEIRAPPPGEILTAGIGK